jgi:hypothetical protein
MLIPLLKDYFIFQSNLNHSFNFTQAPAGGQEGDG